MEDDDDFGINKTPSRRNRFADRGRRHSSDRHRDPLERMQREARHRPLPNQNRYAANLGQRPSSSASSRSQEYNDLGAIPKAVVSQNRNAFRGQMRGIGRSVPDLTRHLGRGAMTAPKHVPRQSSPKVHNPRSAREGGRKHFNFLGFRRLTELNESDMNERELSLTLISSKSGFVELLNQDTIQPDWMKLLLSIIVRACNSTCREYVLQLLNMIAHSRFLEHHITAGFLLKFRQSQLQDQLELMQCVDNIITLLGEISTKLPTFVDKCEVVTIILDTIPDKLTALDRDTKDLLKVKIISIKDRVSDILSTNQKDGQIFTKGERRKREDPDIELQNVPPPNDYRELSICPTNEDIHMEGPAYVRANKATGRYDDHNHYLDVQFRLLREDYIQPLRKGIKEYLKNVADGKPKTKLADVRMYNDVKIVSPKCTPDGIAYSIHFDTTPFKRIRWQASKRLIFGSLVCLSHDNFNTLLFAVVAGRDIKDLQLGLVDIRFTEHFDMGGEDVKKVFVMLETTAYFEAYRHVLAGLQKFTEGVPFQRYIVSCETEVRPPRYLLSVSPPKYDLTCCLAEDVPKSERVGARTVPVLTTSRWPTKNALCFDDSQLQALKTALTKEFAIIQGPPGTGKTYVGLKIVRALLENDAAWGADSPILVVCYTNHALDQFLEGMLDFGAERLIRVGGRSSSERLQKHTIKNIKLSIKKNKDIRREIMDGTKDCWREMKELERQMLADSKKLEVSAKGLLTEKALRGCMTDEQFESFDEEASKGFGRQFSNMMVWLNIGAGTYSQPYDEFGGSHLFSLTPNHIKCFAYSLQMEGESVETVRHFEQMAEKLDHQLSYDSGHNWQIYRQWILRFQQQQSMELFRAEKKLKSMDTKTGHRNQQRGKGTRHIPTAKEVEEARHLRESIEDMKETLQQLNTGILRTSRVRSILAPGEITELRHLGDENDDYLIAKWLGYTDVIQTLVDRQGSGEDDDSNEVDFVDVEEEADNVTNHRILDDDDEAFTLFKAQRDNEEEAERMAVKELAFFLNDKNRQPMQQNGEWQTVGPSKQKLKQKVKQILNGEKMSEDEATQIEDVWDMNVDDKHRLYRYWLDVYRYKLLDKIKGFVEEFERVTHRLRAVRDDEDFDILRKAKVIGMTTTGAARYRNLLQRIMPKIIVVEEAAEVLESHIISSLNSSCEHLILIGDHKQLRPSPAVFDLAQRYKLDLSLFERMVNNRVRCDTLQLQHRMRPEIAEILAFIYPELQNHESVESFEHIKGVSSDIFFLDHDIPEALVDDTKSKLNHHEALFTAALCRYLLLQGYEPSQITVLTAYTGQVFELKKAMPRKIYDGIRVTAVDNYQGEENDIIILSLVRSSTSGPIGFLNVDNRVCVALSRAKKGLFVIGNFKLLAAKSPLWSDIVLLLKSKGACGPVLELYCQNHPITERLKVRTDKDFEAAPEGGCLQPCEARLDCGHQCERPCHVLDSDHKEYKCQKPCAKECKDGHRCSKLCYQPCANCRVVVTKIVPQCNHKQNIPCHQDPLTFKCQANCPKFLSCGHQCAQKCSEEHTAKCQVPVTRMWPCQHPVKTACCHSPEQIPCPTKCTVTLDCDHQCGGTCGACYQGRFHKSCRQKCGRTLVCGHQCPQPCTKACPPCSEMCNNRCPHSKCEKKCGEKCTPCREPCQWKCKHLQCTRLCGDICNRPPCSHSCHKRLPCGHKCIGVCGETCPKLCRICNKETVCEIFLGGEDEIGAKFVMLEDCGCFCEMKGMDQWMSTENPKDESIQMKACPKCNVVIRTSLRYGNRIKETLRDIEEVKLKIRGDTITIEQEKHRLRQTLVTGQLDTEAKVTLFELLDTDLSQHHLNVIDNQISLLVSIRNLQNNIFKENTELKKEDVLDLLQSIEVVTKLIKRLKNFVSDQELKQFKFEILRISFFFKLLLFHKHLRNGASNASKVLLVDLDAALKDLRGSHAFTAEKEIYMRSLVDRLKKVAPLGISDTERIMIVKAVGLTMGHWYKCPNGHVYVIGECGGAMEESKCPDCKAKIGGTQHRLTTGNQLAPEMDGARHAAWSDQANMNNYRFEEDFDNLLI